tara:strand:+ start:1629 stop:1772 length:144 start_codon:yes stop_codon:yes gene_type:complete
MVVVGMVLVVGMVVVVGVVVVGGMVVEMMDVFRYEPGRSVSFQLFHK